MNTHFLFMKIECTEMCISWTYQLSWEKSCCYYNNILVLVRIYLISLIMCNLYRLQMHSFLYLLYLLSQHLAVTFQYSVHVVGRLFILLSYRNNSLSNSIYINCSEVLWWSITQKRTQKINVQINKLSWGKQLCNIT